MQIIPLLSKWQFRQAGQQQWLDAKVPGTVHQDLLTHHIIENPMHGFKEDKAQWVEEKDWEYKTSFIADDEMVGKDVVELFFEGIDTYADMFLNNEHLLSSDNMFTGIKANIKPVLKQGENELRVYFHSPVAKGLEKKERFGHRLPMHNELTLEEKQTSVFTRKAPFHYGWDWGPRLVTCGIWRPVSLQAWNKACIEDVLISANSINQQEAFLIATAEIRIAIKGIYTLHVIVNEQRVGDAKIINTNPGVVVKTIDIRIENPRLWWPNGRGEAYLYELEFLLEYENVIIHHHSLRYGIRTVDLVQRPDENGHTFYFEVNGVPVFAKGANVIPSETLTPSVSRETYQKLIERAISANMNMLRVWGGAIYEEDYFYQLCDENGLLVWQDFMFACSLQPGDDSHLESIKSEAVYNIKRLRNHACIALWCGNNENLHGWHAWGWKDMFDQDVGAYLWKTYEKIFYDILPVAVRQFDSGRSYWPSSPSAINNNVADRKSGDEHDWTIWFGQKPIDAYWNNVPRFVSEWGLQAFPNIATLASFAKKEEMGLNTDVMRHRQRSKMDWHSPGFNGNDMIKWYVEQYYQSPDDFESMVYLSQVLQAEAYKTAIEAHRTAMPHCMGSLFWQLNDCWPTISWSTVDYYYRYKAAHYTVKKAFASVILTARQNGSKVAIFVVSDNVVINDAILKTELIDFSGNVFASKEEKVTIHADKSQLVMNLDLSTQKETDWKKRSVLLFTLYKNGNIFVTNHLFFARPKDLELQKPIINYWAEKTDDHYRVNISSNVLVKNICIEVPDADAHYSDNFFDLFPGKTYVIKVVSCLSAINESDIKLRFVNA